MTKMILSECRLPAFAECGLTEELLRPVDAVCEAEELIRHLGYQVFGPFVRFIVPPGQL